MLTILRSDLESELMNIFDEIAKATYATGTYIVYDTVDERFTEGHEINIVAKDSKELSSYVSVARDIISKHILIYGAKIKKWKEIRSEDGRCCDIRFSIDWGDIVMNVIDEPIYDDDDDDD